MIRIGLDIGSTTIKCIILGNNNEIIFQKYERHYAKIIEKTIEMISLIKNIIKNQEFNIGISGTSGLSVSEILNIPFIQEVYATRKTAKEKLPNSDVVIELGGEDAKILFLNGYDEVRMNGSCAGGTGAFIDQMCALLHVTLKEMEGLASNSHKIYPIASRCGVFAKTDIQPLLNQGAQKKDIAASILNAVVNQTVQGLAQGRKIEGNVIYLGGPLTFFPSLRKAFDHTLQTKGLCPENSLYFVAYGAALCSSQRIWNCDKILNLLKSTSNHKSYETSPPLFTNQKEYEIFKKEHPIIKDNIKDLNKNSQNIYIGIDAGSTTLKGVVMNEAEEIIFSKYLFNEGNPVDLVKQFLEEVYINFPQSNIVSTATTGYGEELIQCAFGIDFGIVETVAHLMAAQKENPSVDFIIDIGGQDIKCFKIHNHTIDSLFLNEACSSGCGSFLQTFSESMGYSVEEFASLGLFAKSPANFGSRCTVFMNSSVKQAQKDGISIEDISAGLSMSVVKNALYKVIRLRKNESLGSNINVQGGTFLNDSVLRAFEIEIGQKVHRSKYSGLMGAYGACLYAKMNHISKSTLLSLDELKQFKNQMHTTYCKGCSNHCQLTINNFGNHHIYISGNQCNRIYNKNATQTKYNMYDFKKECLNKYNNISRDCETIGIPMALNMYELLPFWYTIFRELGFSIQISSKSSKELFHKGQKTIVSDTICYPAKLVHGHIQDLIDKNVNFIFYPCLTYNVDEKKSDNHYNCPVVAYYPEVIANNMCFNYSKILYPYFDIQKRKYFYHYFYTFIKENIGHSFSFHQVKKAIDCGYEEYYNYMESIRNQGDLLLNYGIKNNLPIFVLCGRPYHLDEEINHNIDSLLEDAIILTEDSLSHHTCKADTDVLNQWTYHARLYSAAEFVANHPYKNIHLIQLVSFGCGIDAITSDEVRSILESKNKIYTQIKIDEITNLGAVKIRLRSLIETIRLKEAKHE